MTRTATQIEIELGESPGALEQATSALADEDVNILGFSLESHEARRTVRFVTDDAKGAISALDSVGLTRRTRDVLLVPVPHRPGEFGRITERLSRGGVNVESGFAVARTDGAPGLALGVDEPLAAAKILRDRSDPPP